MIGLCAAFFLFPATSVSVSGMTFVNCNQLVTGSGDIAVTNSSFLGGLCCSPNAVMLGGSIVGSFLRLDQVIADSSIHVISPNVIIVNSSLQNCAFEGSNSISIHHALFSGLLRVSGVTSSRRIDIIDTEIVVGHTDVNVDSNSLIFVDQWPGYVTVDGLTVVCEGVADNVGMLFEKCHFSPSKYLYQGYST